MAIVVKKSGKIPVLTSFTKEKGAKYDDSYGNEIKLLCMQNKQKHLIYFIYL